MRVLGRADHGLGVGERSIRVDAHEVGAGEGQLSRAGARRDDERAVRDALAAGELDLVRVRVDPLDRRLEPELDDVVLVLRLGTDERLVALHLPASSPFVSGGRLYGGSGSDERIVTTASPPAARYSDASRAAASPPPTTTIGSIAMPYQYPVSVRSYAGRFSARAGRPTPPTLPPMAVLIASGLRKEFSGDPLFDGVSFRLRRGDRLALAGPNGAGKTTLLRALVGETSLTSGELAFAKDTRIALHDQRPPRGQGLTLREYSLSGAGDLVAIEEELTRLEQAMASGDHAPATLRRYSEAQARLEHAGGWAWRDRAASILRGLGFRDADLDRPLDTFSGGELTRASLAPRALGGSRPAAPRRADEPPRRREPRVARARADLARRRGRPRRARPLVPRGRDDRRARARRAEAVLLRRPMARVAARESGAGVGRVDAARPRQRTTSSASSAS